MRWPFSRGYPSCCLDDVDSKEFDYIIVGGGTAGCTLASRLSEDPDITVLLLERGPINDKWLSRVPLISSNLFWSGSGAVSWDCEPMKYCDDRQSAIFSGELLGGTSRINGMLYSRGPPADYDAWAEMGHPDWSYEKVLPYFVKGETTLSPWITKNSSSITGIFRVLEAFINAAINLGFTKILDPNAPEAPPDGMAIHDLTLDEKNRRVSTFDAFLPAKIAFERQDSLKICPKAVVDHASMSKQNGKLTCRKVVFKSSEPRSKQKFSATVRKEVIICSGALSSPQILMLSGIGPREHLQEHGIEVLHDLPGVGSNLTDHIGVPVIWEIPFHESLTALAASPILKGTWEMLKYIFTRTGIIGTPMQLHSLFVRSSSLTEDGSKPLSTPSSDSPVENKGGRPTGCDLIPDIELMPTAINTTDNIDEHWRLYSKLGLCSILATAVQPKSRGTVRLASSDPHDRPKVDFGFLSNPADYIVLRKAIRLSLTMIDTMKATGFPMIRGITFPEENHAKDVKNGNTEEMDKFIWHRARPTFHFSCTCRMAPEHDPQAPGVVDDKLRVHGVSNLRVCDTSVFPQIISSHLQAPAVMIAERCADFIRHSV